MLCGRGHGVDFSYVGGEETDDETHAPYCKIMNL